MSLLGVLDRWSDVTTVDKYQASAEVVMGKGPKPANDPSVFDAREVMANLRSTIVMPS